MSLWSRTASAALLAGALAIGVAACGASGEAKTPGLALATTIQAQADLRPLLKRWANALTRAERASLEKELAAFVKAYPNDGQVPAAEALLAWIAVERGELASGKRLSKKAADLGDGSWGDFAKLVDGAIKRRSDDARGAIAVLEPLMSKLIDPWARDLLDEELIAASIAARDTKLAMRAMTVWLREAGDDERALVRSRVERALMSLGNAELIKIFDERTAKAEPSPDSDIDLLLAQRLAKLAVETKDALLAKKLLATSGPLLGESGDAVAHLAAGAAAIRVDARTVGVLLSFRTAETRRRSAELAAGVAWGLELPGSGARLAVRDDAGETEHLGEALTELGRAGAAVVIAGLADDDARAAAKFAQEQHVPVILVARPADVTPAPGSFVFPLGASPEGWLPEKDPRFADGRLTPWKDAYGSYPSFWSAAGRDAAVLARASVKDLPQETTEDKAEIEARRKTVRAALETASLPLWTFDRPAPAPPPEKAPSPAPP